MGAIDRKACQPCRPNHTTHITEGEVSYSIESREGVRKELLVLIDHYLQTHTGTTAAAAAAAQTAIDPLAKFD